MTVEIIEAIGMNIVLPIGMFVFFCFLAVRLTK